MHNVMKKMADKGPGLQTKSSTWKVKNSPNIAIQRVPYVTANTNHMYLQEVLCNITLPYKKNRWKNITNLYSCNRFNNPIIKTIQINCFNKHFILEKELSRCTIASAGLNSMLVCSLHGRISDERTDIFRMPDAHGWGWS